MPGFQMFPRFPEIGDHAPSLESIRSKNPMAFAVFWALLFFFSMVVVPCLLVRYNFLGSFLISFPVLILANLFILYSLASAAEELGKFQTIDDLDDSERWTYEGVVRFFEEHPDLAYYRDEVLRQNRPFFVGEMDALSRKVGRKALYGEGGLKSVAL